MPKSECFVTSLLIKSPTEMHVIGLPSSDNASASVSAISLRLLPGGPTRTIRRAKFKSVTDSGALTLLCLKLLDEVVDGVCGFVDDKAFHHALEHLVKLLLFDVLFKTSLVL